MSSALSMRAYDLGIPHEIVPDTDLSDEHGLYIICTTHEIRPLPPRYISYNFEQLTVLRDDPTWVERVIGRFRNAYEVWDYSMVNVEYLRSQGVDAIFLPFGYSPFMTTHYNDNLSFENKTVDFLFVGLLNTRRKEILDPILNLYTPEQSNKTMVTSQTFKNDLDLAYAKSKVTLNIHFYEGTTILEVHRILPMVANKVWVLSEHSGDKWYDDAYSSVLDFVDLSGPDFVAKYQAIIALEPDRFMTILAERLEVLKAKFSF